MNELSIRITKRIDLDGIHEEIMDGAKDGVEAAAAETTDWIKNDVILNQKYLGNQNYPDVTPATRASKNKRGKSKVLVDTSNLLSSWNFKVSGLEGIVGSGSEGYFDKIYSKWKIDELWKAEHGKESAEIIEKAIKKTL